MKNRTTSESMLTKLTKKDLIQMILELQEENCKLSNGVEKTEAEINEAEFINEHCFLWKVQTPKGLVPVYKLRSYVHRATFAGIAKIFRAKGWEYYKPLQCFTNPANIRFLKASKEA